MEIAALRVKIMFQRQEAVGGWDREPYEPLGGLFYLPRYGGRRGRDGEGCGGDYGGGCGYFFYGTFLQGGGGGIQQRVPHCVPGGTV